MQFVTLETKIKTEKTNLFLNFKFHLIEESHVIAKNKKKIHILYQLSIILSLHKTWSSSSYSDNSRLIRDKWEVILAKDSGKIIEERK